MVVSRWPVSVVAEVPLVSASPPQCVLCAKKFALRGLVVGVCAKKFAQRTKNDPKLVFSGVLGELFRGWGVGGGVLGELFRACQPATATGHGPPLPAGVSEPHVVQFPRLVVVSSWLGGVTCAISPMRVEAVP